MKETVKNVIINCIIVFGICFLLFTLYEGYQEYGYYSKYSKEDLANFFSMKEIILWNLERSLFVTVKQMIIFVPALAILEKINIKRSTKIIIALALTVIITYLYILSNFNFTF